MMDGNPRYLALKHLLSTEIQRWETLKQTNGNERCTTSDNYMIKSTCRKYTGYGRKFYEKPPADQLCLYRADGFHNVTGFREYASDEVDPVCGFATFDQERDETLEVRWDFFGRVVDGNTWGHSDLKPHPGVKYRLYCRVGCPCHFISGVSSDYKGELQNLLSYGFLMSFH